MIRPQLAILLCLVWLMAADLSFGETAASATAGTWFNFTGHARNYGGPLFEVDKNWPSAFYFDDAY
ncbi:MAG TPA: hypothetical protein DCX07_03575 [Phycisphaerales bacterium]|nr:hypothetical protein [Phycisphaerales bacterium]